MLYPVSGFFIIEFLYWIQREISHTFNGVMKSDQVRRSEKKLVSRCRPKQVKLVDHWSKLNEHHSHKVKPFLHIQTKEEV